MLHEREKNKVSFKKTFESKKVIVTGHTGFKGSWLSFWLVQLGDKVTGIALDPPTKPSMFDCLALADILDDRRINIKDQQLTQAVFDEIQPDFVFHFGCAAIGEGSYKNPAETWETNVLGTVNVLLALNDLKKPTNAVLITSDKC